MAKRNVSDFQILSRRVLFKSDWTRVERVRYRFGGKTYTREFSRRAKGSNMGVIIAPVTPEKNLIFIKQIRPALPFSSSISKPPINLELPGGGVEVDDRISPDRVDFTAAARRELLEEVGLDAVLVSLFHSGVGDAGFHGEEIVAFAGFNATEIPKKDQPPEDDEQRAIVEVIPVPLTEAEEFFFQQLEDPNQYVDLKILPVLLATKRVAQRLSLI